MLKNRIKDIAKDSSIYGLSKVIGQAVGFFLIPLYTQYLSPSDYGILNLLGTASVSFGLLMTFGLDSGTYRFAGLASSESEERKVLGTAQLLNLVCIFVMSLILFFSKEILKELLLEWDTPVFYILIGIFISIFASISSINRAYFRIKRRVKIIALASLLNVFFSIASTLIFVTYFKWGVVGALLGNLVGNFVSSFFLFLNSLSIIGIGFDLLVVKNLLGYSMPVIPAQLLGFTIPLYSQWSIKEILSLNDLGLYAIGLKFTIPISLLIGMFQQAYGPYKFEILKTDDNPKNTFRIFFNLYILFFSLLIILTTFFGDYVIELLTPPNFHEAKNLLFFIAFVPFSQGIYFMMSSGLEVAKSPIYRPLVSLSGFLLIVVSVNFFVNNYGIAGAAISVSLSYLVQALGNYIYAQVLYPINYDWAFIFSSFLLCLLAAYFKEQLNFFERLLVFFFILSIAVLILKKYLMIKPLCSKV